MSKDIEARGYDEALAWLREHGFDVTEAPGTNGRVFLRKYNVSAAIQKTAEDGVKIFAYPGYLVGSEISKLVNRGYQQFLKNSKTEIPATADHLKALQSFAEELKVGLGLPSLYNESLGTVSESYQYDRIEDRDKAPVNRPKRPWEVAGKAVAAKAVAAKKGRA
jgi:sugar phosphate isomerase/epimerase